MEHCAFTEEQRNVIAFEKSLGKGIPYTFDDKMGTLVMKCGNIFGRTSVCDAVCGHLWPWKTWNRDDL